MHIQNAHTLTFRSLRLHYQEQGWDHIAEACSQMADTTLLASGFDNRQNDGTTTDVFFAGSHYGFTVALVTHPYRGTPARITINTCPFTGMFLIETSPQVSPSNTSLNVTDGKVTMTVTPDRLGFALQLRAKYYEYYLEHRRNP